MADSPQSATSPPPLREPVVGFVGGKDYSVSTLGSTLRVELGSKEWETDEDGDPYLPPGPVLTIEVSTPKEAAQMLLLMSTIQRFINYLYPNGV